MLDSFPVLALGLLSGFFVIGVLTTTAFTKIAVVFFIIRNALGIQQVPSNLTLQTFAFVLAVYIAVPVISGSYEVIKNRPDNVETPEQWIELGLDAATPVQEFLRKNTDPEQKAFFVRITKKLWKDANITAQEDDIVVLIPAFMVTELKNAFEIGFLLYLPFIAIDLALTTVLMAMGMMMVPPTIIGVPFKLLLFILIGGWEKLIEGLLLTYGG